MRRALIGNAGEAPQSRGSRPAGTPPGPQAADPPRASLRTDARVLLALGGPMLFSAPVMALAERDWTLLGVPALVIYVFLAWLVGIVLTALAARGPRENA